MNRERLTISIGLACLLFGCDASDPTKGGFIGGVVGDLSGSYDARIERRQQALEAARLRSEQAAGEQGALEKETAAKRGQALALERESVVIENEFRDLERALQAMKGQEQANQDAIRGAEAEIAQLRADFDKIETRSQGDVSQSEQQATLLRAEISKLREEVERLDETAEND